MEGVTRRGGRVSDDGRVRSDTRVKNGGEGGRAEHDVSGEALVARAASGEVRWLELQEWQRDPQAAGERLDVTLLKTGWSHRCRPASEAVDLPVEPAAHF